MFALLDHARHVIATQAGRPVHVEAAPPTRRSPSGMHARPMWEKRRGVVVITSRVAWMRRSEAAF